jgi:hypothetical protein
MGIELRYPNITAHTDREQLAQLKSYLYQLVEQLQFALNDQSGGGGAVQYYDEMYAKLSSQFLPKIERVSAEIKKVSDAINLDDKGWMDIGISSEVSDSYHEEGRTESGCYYRVCQEKSHIYVAFNCHATLSAVDTKVNDIPIAEEYRPSRNAHGICAAGGTVAHVVVTTDGNVFVSRIQTMSQDVEVEWIDGYIDYWI